ncbi:FluG domain-containing protein [Coccidioides immitis RS]|uniref:FluG domain-containing protein n=1 Tax=Coccidioides immitis (strain RS) TaxID=246410 RepID=A0A0E1RVJ7_COCIM|nr:FluG domain-containing protein [Coccidioides immitis RS]EAS29980.2 FluG domain-containing protein [Coccidioides immitis RS]
MPPTRSARARAPAPASHYQAIVSGPPRSVRPDWDDSTRYSIDQMQKNFEKFVAHLSPPDPSHWLKQVNLSLIEGFLRWYLDIHEQCEKAEGFKVRVRFWRMYYCNEMKQEFPYELKLETKYLVHELVQDYALDETGTLPPNINGDDLFYMQYHLQVNSTIWFPTQRQRSQHGTLRKMMTATSARAGTLVVSSGYLKKPDSLLWGDIQIFMVANPESPSCRVLLVHATHRLNKGKRNKGRPPIYSYFERNDNLAFCVVQDILEYGFQDDVYSSPFIKKPRDIWQHTQIPKHRLSVPIHIKPEKWDLPIFRPGRRDAEGRWTTHPQNPLTFNQFAEDEVRACRSAGLKEIGGLKRYRKGAAAVIANLNEHKRNHIMGHARAGVFQYYVNQRVDTDIQSMFLETPTQDALVKLSTNSSLTRDPSAPQELSNKQKAEVENNVKLEALKKKRLIAKAELIADYGKICNVNNPEKRAEYEHLCKRIRATRKKLRREAFREVHANFFQTIGDKIIEQNYHGQSTVFEPDTSSISAERKELAALEFKNQDATYISDQELVEDRIRSLELRLRLHSLTIPKPLAAKVVACKSAEKSLDPQSFTGLECPICLGFEDYNTISRTYRFANCYVLNSHIDDVHGGISFSAGWCCNYPPGCGVLLHSMAQLKCHAVKAHRTQLPGAKKFGGRR